MLSPVLIERFVAHGVESARRSLLDLVDEATVRRGVAASVDAAVGAAVGAMAPPGIESRTPRFGSPQSVEWGDARSMIVVPTAEADSRPSPHGVVLLRSDDPCSDTDLAAMLHAARAAFGTLDVDRIALFVHGPLPDDGPLAPGAHGAVTVTPYKRWSAASIDAVASAPRGDDDARIEVVGPADLSFYPEYEAMYESFWADHPELGAQIGIESREALTEYMQHDGLRVIHVDGRLAGVAAALRHAEFGLRGWRIRERVLAPGFRGIGLGTATLRAFVESLERKPGDLVWGTILPENIGSRRTAERLGRRDVGGLLWLSEGPAVP